MQTLIKKAQKGKTEAMTDLFNRNKSTIWFLCQVFLIDERESDDATVFVVKRAWEEVTSESIHIEEDFVAFTIWRAAIYCKSKVLKRKERAFHIPVESYLSSYSGNRDSEQ